MKIITPRIEVLWTEAGETTLHRIEVAGRTAHKSEAGVSQDSAAEFVKMIVARQHFSVLEHVVVSARVVCDRGVSHEIVRHRIASYTQESTRFCNYSEKKFGGEILFVLPSFLYGKADDDLMFQKWRHAVQEAERTYLEMIRLGAKPEEARSVLPNSLKTEMVMTMNLREWRHFFSLRTATAAHPDMQIIAKSLLAEFRSHIPVVFDDVGEL
ncbi:MAG: FAD-dependent thymidylate synthase [Thermoguttaceae bacterium]